MNKNQYQVTMQRIKEYIDNNSSGDTTIDFTTYQTKTDSTLTTTEKSVVGAINELNTNLNAINIPTSTSELTNDSGFITSIPSEYITEDELDAKGYLTEHQDLSAYAKTSDLPTKTSDLTNDSGYITSIPDEYITEDELTAKGYATTSQIPSTLPANGGNADTTDGFHIWQGTQTEFDAITTRDANTIYLVKEG